MADRNTTPQFRPFHRDVIQGVGIGLGASAAILALLIFWMVS